MSAVSSSNGIERRMARESRVGVADGERKIRGTAIVFNSESLDLGGFREIIRPEAVDRALSADVRALVDHDSSKIIGRTRAGTLALRKTRKGLEVEIDPPNTSYANDILESVSRGDVSGMSFGFRVLVDEWRMQDGEAIREVLDLDLNEVSVVTFPAYPATDVAVAQRSLEAFRAGMAGSRLDYLAKVMQIKRRR